LLMINLRHLAVSILACVAAAQFPRAGIKCSTDSDCYSEFEFCNDESSKCEHRDLFPLRNVEIGACAIFAFLVSFSNFSGIGGGFGLIPLFAMFKFNVPIGIVLSNAQIMVSCTIRITSGLSKPHPLKDPYGTLYHFPIISLMIPMSTVGSTLATLIRKMIPYLFIVIIYAVVMTGVFAFNFNRLMALVKKESTKTAVIPV